MRNFFCCFLQQTGSITIRFYLSLKCLSDIIFQFQTMHSQLFDVKEKKTRLHFCSEDKPHIDPQMSYFQSIHNFHAASHGWKLQRRINKFSVWIQKSSWKSFFSVQRKKSSMIWFDMIKSQYSNEYLIVTTVLNCASFTEWCIVSCWHFKNTFLLIDPL